MCGYVHNAVAHRKEHTSGQRLRKEIGQIVYGGDVGDGDAHLLHQFADVEVATVDVLRPLMMLRVIRQIACTTPGSASADHLGQRVGSGASAEPGARLRQKWAHFAVLPRGRGVGL